MANCTTKISWTTLQVELTDRFGLLPDPVRALLDCHRLRIAAKPLGITRIEASADSIQIAIHPQSAGKRSQNRRAHSAQP